MKNLPLTAMILCFAATLVAFPSDLSATEVQAVVHHETRITFDLETHGFSVVDVVTVPAGVDTFHLSDGLIFETGTDFLAVDDGEIVDGCIARAFPGAGTWTLAYSGTAFQPTSETTFSRENVGNEITATIGDEGIYLSGSACCLMYCPGAMATWTLTVDTPIAFHPVTQGRRTGSVPQGDRMVTTFEIAHPSDGLNLIARPFIVFDAMHDDIAISVCLSEDDTELGELYLQRTHAYLDMYTEMLGPYPYSKFTTVENWFPTGYGMPGWTLLGGMVMRLPFIPYTSFGHEICHNWWGNSVFVDASEGNWCEGLTVYCADYHYKELESAEAAREYRRTTLKAYEAYVGDEDKDFPLVEFKSRHSGATRAVGYGKSMMVFHMIEEAIGRDAFQSALRSVYADRKFKQTTWDDFMAAFSAASGRDFSDFATQWLERAGGPALAIVAAKMDGDKLHLELKQAMPSFGLDVPLTITTAEGPIRQTVRLDDPTGRYELDAAGAVRVAIDPDFHLFRRLHPEEIEATIAQVLADEVPYFVLPSGTESEVAAARAFAVEYTGIEMPTCFEDARPPVDVRYGTTASGFFLNSPNELLQPRLPEGITLAGDYLFLDGKRYSLAEYDLVLATYNPHDRKATDLVIMCRSAERLTSIAGRIQHYGKYSWLLMPVKGGRPLRGNWPTTRNPLAVDLK